MPTAFVLVNTEIGSELAVLSELKKVERVKEAVAIYGAYDIMVRVASESMDEVKQTIVWNIRKMDRVRATLTMIIDENKGVPKDQLYSLSYQG